MDFNPLDILAAAAVLQSHDPKSSDQCGTRTESETSSCNDTETEAADEEGTDKFRNMGSARKVRSEIKRQNSCNLPSTVGMLFNGSLEGEVNTHVNGDELRRTLRRNSWSADNVTDHPNDEARDNVSSSTENDLSPIGVESSNDFTMKMLTETADKCTEEDKCEPEEIGSKSESGIFSGGVSSDDDNSDIPQRNADAEHLVSEGGANNGSLSDMLCPVCHKPKTRSVNGLRDTNMCTLCEQQTVKDREWLESKSLKSEGSSVLDVTETVQSDVNSGSEQEDPVPEASTSRGSVSFLNCDVKMDTAGRQLVTCVQSDHCYASQPGKVLDRMSLDSYENGGESDSCGEYSCTEEVEHRARSMSMESECLHCDLGDKHFSLPVKGPEDSDRGSTETALLSPTSSVDSSLTDFPPVRLSYVPAHDKILEPVVQHQTAQGYSFSDGCDDTLGSPTSSVDSLQGQIPPKVGKFRIGMFASFSSSNMDSDSSLTDHKHFKLSKDHSTSSSPFFDKGLMGSPPMSVPESPGIPSFLQSPCGDWDRSDAGSEVQDELGPPHCNETTSELKNMLLSGYTIVSSVDHDHDYCLRDGHLPQFLQDSIKSERRKNSAWTRAKSGMVRHIKEPKLKARVKTRKPKMDLFDESAMSTSTEEAAEHFKQPFEVDLSSDRTHSGISRSSRRRLEKLQEQLDLDNGSKLKITGKFKDDYVYYLNKSSRSRRRASTTLPTPPPSDKIILPAPKPGDIIVPHLTDADIEAIKLRGKAGLSISEKYYGAGLSSALHRSHPSTESVPSKQETVSVVPPEAAATEIITDVDSKIISTILSMENDNLGSPASTHDSSLSESVDLYSPSEDSMGINFMGENMTLTPDQVNMLLDAVKDVETTPEEIIKSGDVKYELDSNQNYDEHLEVPADEKSVDEDTSTSDETERRTSVSSATSDMDTDTKDSYGWSKIEPPEAASTTAVSMASSQVSVSVASSVSTAAKLEVPPTVNPNASPVKALLEADLHTISDNTPLRDLMPTLEKPFELLESDFRLDKSDLFPDAAVAESHPVSATATAGTSDYNTPWIVTVTMYWNDLPAIMIDNQPFVRLVDIHKQILPAKDTGILKKRCQLLGIEVLNCSEMQRYFLVQYGRAYNSKSTLIVSKDDAKDLIGYYVNPQPRVLRPEEILRKDDSETEGSITPSQLEGQSIKSSVVSAPRRKARRRDYPRIPAIPKVEVVSPELMPKESTAVVPVTIAAAIPTAQPLQVSKRLRHKKINFLEMLKGETSSEVAPQGESGDKKGDEDDTATDKKTSLLSASGKKKSKLSDAEKLKLAKEELKKRKIELVEGAGKKSSRVVEQDSEEENHLVSAKRRKYNSSKSKKVPTLRRNRSRLKKVGPLKVKIKGLLNFKGGKRSSASNDSKVIEIRHKDPKPSNAHPSVTQDGDIHLDLYQKKSSLCIKCCSCKKFFSLRNFLSHQHYPDDFEILTTVAQPQILEPRSNKLSDKKKVLWQEFNRRRKELEGTKPVNQVKSVVVPGSSVPLAKTSVNTINTTQSSKTHLGDQTLLESLRYKPGSELEAELRKKVEVHSFKQPLSVKLPVPNPLAVGGVRASSRKRKERQLFPIENYSFTKKAKLDLPPENDSTSGVAVQKSESVSAVLSNSVLTLSNGPELTNFTALENAPEV